MAVAEGEHDAQHAAHHQHGEQEHRNDDGPGHRFLHDQHAGDDRQQAAEDGKQKAGPSLGHERLHDLRDAADEQGRADEDHAGQGHDERVAQGKHAAKHRDNAQHHEPTPFSGNWNFVRHRFLLQF